MKKVLLGGFIFFDLVLVGGSGFILYSYISRKMPVKSWSALGTSKAATAPAKETNALTASPDKKIGGNPPVPGATGDSSMRKILFSYRSPRSKQVSIRADFTGWKAEPMQKAANGTWTYQAQLTPGEYAYCFTADDKTFKDPFNKRTKQIGRTAVSAIVVEAGPAKAIK